MTPTEKIGPSVKSATIIRSNPTSTSTTNCHDRLIAGPVHEQTSVKLRDDQPISTRFKLSSLWASTMFCYVYGDYFGLYGPGKIASIAQGHLGAIGQATPAILVAVSLMMAVPSLLIAFALFAPATLCRWSNIAFGLFYTAIMAVTMPGAQPFYFTLGVIEMLLTVSIALVAWTWPVAMGEQR